MNTDITKPILATEQVPDISTNDEWDKEHHVSDKVIVWEGEENQTYFGQYNHFLKGWNVSGRLGNIQVNYWMPIPKI